MAAKFQVGDLARVGGTGRPLPACYPWLYRGRVCKIVEVVRTRSEGNYLKGRHHTMYRLASRHGQPQVLLASFDLRRPEERDRAPGAGRRKQAVV